MNIYILELHKKNKFYIVQTDNIEKNIKNLNKYNIQFIKDNNGINKYEKSEIKNENIDLVEKYEVILRMIKYGYNNIKGWIFKNTLKKKDYIRIKQEILEDKYLEEECNKINKMWNIDLENKIIKEIEKKKNTTCFNCGRKGHYAEYCYEEYNTDGIYIKNM